MNAEKKFIRGFNDGYTLAEHEPDILNKIVKNLNSTNDYIQGIVSGKEEFEFEKSRTHLDDLTRIRNKPKDLDRGLERE
ncbi:MAG: hypothetical protein Q8935_00230 [Bacillota bacterium]|nr:hypothetical protein [Bacillota bacterium]